MIYREAVPKPSLQSVINCFWMIESDRPGTLRDRTFPDGCQEIIFNVGTQVRRDDGKGYFRNPPVELVGQMTRPYDIVTQGTQCFFGVKFYPHSFSLFTRESIHDLRDQSIDLRELLPEDVRGVIDSVMTHADFDHFVEVMESSLERRMAVAGNPTHSYRLVDRGVRAMFSRAAVSVDALAQSLNISERYLQQAFRRHVGLSPKQLWKMVRFQRTFQYLHRSSYALTDIAHECGYFDQAHFAHDFKALAGSSPSDYRRMQNPLNAFFLAETSRAYLCNYSVSAG